MTKSERRNEIAAVTAERVYVLPHPLLRRAISHYTLFRPAPDDGRGSGEFHIVPDASGCIVCAMTERLFAPRFWGPTSRVATVPRNNPGMPLMAFVEFLPGGAGDLLARPMAELENIVVPLECLDARLANAVSESFTLWFHERRRFDGLPFFRDLDALFLKRFNPGNETLLARHIVSTVKTSCGVIRTGDIARETGYSERHVNRLASERFGMGVKLLSRIVRVNSACRAMLVPGRSLTAVAHDLDYHDQSHFIRDFKSVCGVTPGTYLERMSDFYNEELKMSGNMPNR